MTEEDAARRVGDLVGLSVASVDWIDTNARQAAAARKHGDWGTDCGWRTNPDRAASRITQYLDSFE